ncbi:MAG TPA: hypothetical protein DDW90_02635 [Cyanobacteria bacterium UBA9971]|nr:hypothetical protein [Cyanobacteria bacterium UBA9971]
MYQVYIKTETGFDRRKLLGEYSDYAEVCEIIEAELAKNKETKYIIEETTGHVNIYGDLEISVIDEN